MAKNTGESVLTKLKVVSKERRMTVDSLITIYAQQRFLYRLSVSRFANDFALKGGLLMTVYHNGELTRPTKDLDLHGFDDQGTIEKIVAAITEISSIELPEDDGVRFIVDTLDVRHAHEGIIPGGKIQLGFQIHTAIKKLEIDVAFNNVITPDAPLKEVPTLFPGTFPQPLIRTYPLQTVVAEKLHAMAQFGILNVRHKDYYDIWRISRDHPMDGETLSAAIKATFAAQQRELKLDLPALTEEFGANNQVNWRNYLKKIGKTEPEDYVAVIADIREMLIPAIESALGEASSPGDWVPGVGWQDRPGMAI